MNIENLTLQSFRNISHMQLAFCPGINVIYGDNAQGKTNLLESIWLCTGSASFRGAKTGDLIAFGQPQAQIDLTYFAENRQQQITLRLGENPKAMHNGIKLRGLARLSGQLQAVVFAPEHLALIKEGPSQRRRFLDHAIAQLMPRYGKYLADYSKVIAHRAALLSDSYSHPQLLSSLPVWDEHFAKLALAIGKARLRYLQRLTEAARPIYHDISKGGQVLNLTYCPTTTIDITLTDEENLANIRQNLQDCRQEDTKMGACTCGPHRDDVLITLDDKDARLYASQGQQRSCALTLKLAECALMQEVLGQPPLILLDDVLSELDHHRREYLLAGLTKNQVFITCCDRQNFLSPQSCEFHIKDGAILPCTCT